MKSLTNFLYESLMVEAKGTPLDEQEIEAIKDWFDEHTKTHEYIEKDGCLSVYFPDRATVKSGVTRVGLNGLPHISFSKPPRLKGGFGVTIYKKNNWSASEFPSPRSAFDENGKPKYSTIDDLIALLDKNFESRWAERLDADVK